MKTIVRILLALAFAALASSVHAEFKWQHFGAAPYATSQEEACKKASAAIDGFNMPSMVKDHFKSVLGATCKGGTEKWLTPQQKLEQMWTGGKKPHVMNNVTVAEIPVATSPDGRPYRKGSVAETVKALSWVFIHEGKTYVLYDPLVCGNWSWAFARAPVEQCIEVRLTVPVGTNRTVRFTTVRREPITDFNCWGVIEREWRTGSPHNCDWCEWTQDGVIEMHRRFGGNFRFFHTSIYAMHADVGATEVTLVFPPAARDGGVAVCVEVDGKIFEVALVLPSTWKGAKVTIPADFWVHPRVIDP